MAAGMQALRRAGAEFFIHCGDVGSQQILDHLAGERALFVWGNNDWDRAPLSRYAASLSLAGGQPFESIQLDQKNLGVTHGDDTLLLRGQIQSQQFDYVFTGHTHVPHDRRVGRTRWINPGALHRARQKSVAILDLATDQLQFIPVDV
jgi:putative phosphoesterase